MRLCGMGCSKVWQLESAVCQNTAVHPVPSLPLWIWAFSSKRESGPFLLKGKCLPHKINRSLWGSCCELGTLKEVPDLKSSLWSSRSVEKEKHAWTKKQKTCFRGNAEIMQHESEEPWMLDPWGSLWSWSVCNPSLLCDWAPVSLPVKWGFIVPPNSLVLL